VAEGAVAAIAPVLKQLFRVAGEGVFTDRDQQLLLDMVPKRTDFPQAREAKLANIDKIVFVCHSLGGIYALHLANAFPQNVLGAVTLSSPYGGAESADYAKYFLPFNRLLRDIGPSSAPMKSASTIQIQHPWLNVVTTRGDSPWIMQPNDGVVTVNSMRHRSEMQFEELYINHYEVVMSPKTVDIIKEFVYNIK
jgi:hypothetical protein